MDHRKIIFAFAGKMSELQAELYKQSASQFPIQNEEAARQEYINQCQEDSNGREEKSPEEPG